jgi:hypothetical protein
MNTAPDISEMLEVVDRLTMCLLEAARYCEHPDVTAIPFAKGAEAAARNWRAEAAKGQRVLLRAGW